MATTSQSTATTTLINHSFHDFDYIISVNEKRFDDYLNAYHKVVERFTNLIVIYSALTIFFFPLLQDIIMNKTKSVFFISCFAMFVSFFAVSIYNTIQFLMPQDIPYLKQPKEFYTVLLKKYQTNPPSSGALIDDLLKASYINELETAQASIMDVLMRKGNLYYKGLVYSLISAVPYLICLGYYFSREGDQVQQFRMVN